MYVCVVLCVVCCVLCAVCCVRCTVCTVCRVLCVVRCLLWVFCCVCVCAMDAAAGVLGYKSSTSSVEALIKNSDAHLDGCKLMLKRMRTLISWPRAAKHPLAEWLTARGLCASMLRILFQNVFRVVRKSQQFPTNYEHILKTGFAGTTNKKRQFWTKRGCSEF